MSSYDDDDGKRTLSNAAILKFLFQQWARRPRALTAIGTLFLARDERVPFFHAAWHLFVIAGSACHFAAVWLYVVLPGT